MDYVKLTTENCIHNNYKYKEGLNILDGEFNDKHICDKGGLYFCRKRDMARWRSYSDKSMYYIWDVVLLENSKLVDMYDKLKTDRFILKNKRIMWHDNEFCKFVIERGCKLRNIPFESITEEICKLAVTNDHTEISNVPERLITREICELAVKHNYNALKYIPCGFITREICEFAD